MPSTQLPLTHAKSAMQVLPFGFFWQVPPTQLLPPFGSVALGARVLQSVLDVLQLVLHAFGVAAASHWKVPHETAAGVIHIPAPLHFGAGTTASDSETGTPLTVPATAGAQAAFPQTTPAACS